MNPMHSVFCIRSSVDLNASDRVSRQFYLFFVCSELLE